MSTYSMISLTNHVFHSLCMANLLLITQHCTLDGGSYTKDLSMVNEDLSSVFILDNSPGAYRYNPGKSIKEYDLHQLNLSCTCS